MPLLMLTSIIFVQAEVTLSLAPRYEHRVSTILVWTILYTVHSSLNLHLRIYDMPLRAHSHVRFQCKICQIGHDQVRAHVGNFPELPCRDLSLSFMVGGCDVRKAVDIE